MRTIKLTNDQATLLSCYLLMTTNYRKDEQEACQRLAQEKKADGTPRFPKMESNANWWEKTIAEIAKIQKAIDDAPYSKEDTQ